MPHYRFVSLCVQPGLLIVVAAVSLTLSGCCCGEFIDGVQRGIEEGSNSSSSSNSRSDSRSQSEREDTANKDTKKVTGAKGLVEVEVPKSWSIMESLHTEANVELGNVPEASFFIVITESKVDFEDSLVAQSYSDMTRAFTRKTLSNYTEDGPKVLTVNGLPAVQYTLRGSLDGLKLVYLHTSIEGPKHFHQVLAWTSPSHWDQNEETFLEVVRSLKDLNASGKKSKKSKKSKKKKKSKKADK